MTKMRVTMEFEVPTKGPAYEAYWKQFGTHTGWLEAELSNVLENEDHGIVGYMGVTKINAEVIE